MWGLALGGVAARADHRDIPAATDSQKLKLSELVTEALERNQALKASEQEVTAKEAQVGPQGAYEDPMLSFEAMNYPVDTFSAREFGMTGNQVSLSQKVPFPGKLGKKSDTARSEADAQKEMLRRKRLEIVRDLKRAYDELFVSYKKLDLLNEQKTLYAQLIDVTRSRYSLGKAAQAEVLNLQLEEANVMDQILVQRKQVQAKLGELNHLLGRVDHNAYLYGRPEDLVKTPFDFAKHPEKEIADKVVAAGPMAKEKQAMVAAADSRLSYAKRGYLPDLEFKLGYTFRKPSPGDRGVDFASAMVGITIPLWAGAKQSEEVRGASAERQRAEAMLSEQRIELAHMVHVLYAEIEESNQRITLYEGGVLPLTRQAAASGRSAYLTGKIDYATLLSLISKRYQMEMAYYEALATYESKLAELEALAGEPLGAGT